ncbi:MAG: DUF4393 domain-containing protein [Desulfobacteraceae bacterium]|nr:DUF4393 domain-containing protein [Desulfobacteraceae bacterium]MBC2750193.1 DUF4393 domain-containing protein [Desulfobacteraceae bacterium]
MNDSDDIPKEVAKTLTKETVREIGRFLEMVVGEPLKGIGGIASDQVSYWRYINLLKLKDKVDAIHVERAFEGKTLPIPPRYAIPIIETASTEDNETIQDLWAGLIANAVDSSKRLSMNKRYIRILTDMEPLDAQVLELLMQDFDLKTKSTPEEAQGLTVSQLSKAAGCSQDEIQMSILNLYQMQCIVDYSGVTWTELNSKSIFTSTNKPDARFQLSPLGISLLEACKH